MPSGAIPLAKEIDRVPSSTVPLDHAQEQRFQRLMEPLIMVDVHVHPMVLGAVTAWGLAMVWHTPREREAIPRSVPG